MSPTILILVVLSAVVHTTWNAAAKRVAGDIGVLWLGQLLAALCVLPFAIATATPAALEPRALLHLVATGVLQAVYFAALSKGYAKGDFSVVYPIARGLGVAGSALSARLFLGESVSDIGAAGIALIGCGSVALGLSRGGADLRILGWTALIGLTLAAGNTNDKLAVGIVHPVFYIFCMFALAVLVTLPRAMGPWRPLVRRAWREHRRSAFVVGIGSMSGYLIILFAFRLGPMSYVVAFRELSVVLGALFGVIVLRERLHLRKAVGVLAIVSGLVLVKIA